MAFLKERKYATDNFHLYPEKCACNSYFPRVFGGFTECYKLQSCDIVASSDSRAFKHIVIWWNVSLITGKRFKFWERTSLQKSVSEDSGSEKFWKGHNKQLLFGRQQKKIYLILQDSEWDCNSTNFSVQHKLIEKVAGSLGQFQCNFNLNLNLACTVWCKRLVFCIYICIYRMKIWIQC